MLYVETNDPEEHIHTVLQVHDNDSSKKSEEKSSKNKDNYGTHSDAHYGNQDYHQAKKGSQYHDNQYGDRHYGHKNAHNRHHYG